MKYLYRYRTIEKHNIEALRNFNINGTLYSKFESLDELNYDLSPDIVKPYGVSEEQRLKFIEIIKDNSKEHYCLASFTENKPTKHREEWAEYGGNGTGFCLVYKYDDIIRAKKDAIIRDKAVLEFLKVHYTNTPYELAPFFIKALKVAAKNVNSQNVEEMIKQAFEESYSKKLGKYIVQGFAQKGSRHVNFREYRLILQVLSKNHTSPFVKCMLVVKPYGIVFGDKMNFASKYHLTEFASANDIKILSIND